MPQTHPQYPAEYRRRIIELARAGRSVNELAREFEPSASAIRYWLKQAGLDEGLPQSLPKTADSSPAVLPEAGPVTATVLARIGLNGAFEQSSQFPLSRCCDDRLNSPNILR
jgi:transposase-like protein